MPGLGNYLETLLLRNLFKTTTALPSSIWVSLHSATVVDAADGAEISTVGTNYNRIAVAPTSVNWASLAAPSSGSTSTTFNKLAITFATAASSYSVQAFGLWDSSNTGNLMYLSTVPLKVIEVGDNALISSADIRISFD